MLKGHSDCMCTLPPGWPCPDGQRSLDLELLAEAVQGQRSSPEQLALCAQLPGWGPCLLSQQPLTAPVGPLGLPEPVSQALAS